MNRFLLVLLTVSLVVGAPELWWMGKTIARCRRQRRRAGNLIRTGLSLYAAVLTMLGVVAFFTLFWLYGLGLLIAVLLAPFAFGTGLSAEVLWDRHPKAAGSVAALSLAVASLGLERLARAPDAHTAAPWLHGVTGLQLALAVGCLLHVIRSRDVTRA
jgi:hypothetical protein